MDEVGLARASQPKEDKRKPAEPLASEALFDLPE